MATATGWNLGTAWVQITPSMSGFNKAVASEIGKVDVSGATRSWGSSISSGIGGAFKTAAVVGATAIGAIGASIAGLAIKGGFERALNIENAEAKLKGLKLSAADVESVMGNALTAVEGTAFGLGDAATVAATMVASGVKHGDQLTSVLTTVADVAQFSGRSMTDVGTIFSSVLAKGKLQGDDLLQLTSAGVPALEYLASEMGTTAEAVSEMVSKGEVDFQTFADAMQSGLGGAALAAGETFSGAWANVQNALSKGGAQFMTPVMDGLRVVFNALIPVIKQANAALAPFAEILGEKVAAAAEKVATWLGTVDFTEFTGGLTAFGAAWTAFDGDVTSSGFPGFMERLAFISRTVWEEMRGGIQAFGAAWEANDGDITSSGLPGFMEWAAFAIRQVVDYVGMLDFTSWSGFVDSLGTGQPALASIGNSFETLAPAAGEFVAALPNMAGALGTLAASILPLVAGALGFLADNIDSIIAWMPALVAGFVAWRVASMAFTAAQVAQAPILLASNTLGLSRALIDMQVARSTAAATTAQVANNAATNGGVLANIRATASLIAQKTAMIATSVATKAAAAAQWVMNAAMSANPIMLVVLAIAALVAGLVWFFTQTELGAAIWTNFTTAIGAAWTWLWENVLSPVFTAIGAIFTWLYENVIAPIVVGIVLYVQVWAAIFTWLWQNVLSPTFAAIGAIFGWIYNNIIVPIVSGVILYVQKWGAIFTWLWVNIVTPVFAGIQAAILAVYTWFTGTLVPGFQAVIAVFGAAFSWVNINVIQPVWRGIQEAIWNVYNWFNGTLVPTFKTAIGFIGTAFENLKTTISTVWDNIKKAAVAPINFVIQTVYNDGIKALFDDIAEAVGLDLRMPTASTIALATGGVLPGYTPGRDVHNFYSPTGGRLALSGGEGIIRPDALRALGGKAWLDQVNGARGSAGRVGHFANGGIWEEITGGIAGAASWIGDAVGNVTKIMTDPAGAIDSLIRTPVKALLESIGGGSFGSIVAEIPLKAIDGIAEWAQNNITPPAPSSGEWIGGNTLERLRPLIAKHGLMITDTYRDPAYNAAVGGVSTSYHLDKENPAVDVAGSYGAMNAFANDVAAVGGWRQLLWQVAGHFDHVHVAAQGGVYGDLPTRTYDSGGWLDPGLSLAYNGTGSPEPIFTSGQWSQIKSLANGSGTGNSGDLVLEIDGDPAMVELVKLMDIRIKGSEDDRRVLVRAGG